MCVVCKCGCMWGYTKSEDVIRCLPQSLLNSIFWDSFSTKPGGQQLSGRADNELQVLACLQLPSTGVTGAYLAFTWMQGFRTQVLMLKWQVLSWLSHHPNPSFLPFYYLLMRCGGDCRPTVFNLWVISLLGVKWPFYRVHISDILHIKYL